MDDNVRGRIADWNVRALSMQVRNVNFIITDQTHTQNWFYVWLINTHVRRTLCMRQFVERSRNVTFRTISVYKIIANHVAVLLLLLFVCALLPISGTRYLYFTIFSLFGCYCWMLVGGGFDLLVSSWQLAMSVVTSTYYTCGRIM